MLLIDRGGPRHSRLEIVVVCRSHAGKPAMTYSTHRYPTAFSDNLEYTSLYVKYEGVLILSPVNFLKS